LPENGDTSLGIGVLGGSSN
jgi:hypothetical protein